MTLGLVWRNDDVIDTKRYKVSKKMYLVDTLGKYLRNAVSGKVVENWQYYFYKVV